MGDPTSIEKDQQDDDAKELLIRSYRFLRLGTAVLGIAILTSMLIEYCLNGDGDFETSISAYYYTAARPVFTGALVAIGASLLAIKGRTTWEDIWLNLAGMMAPLVPFIPPGDASKDTGSTISEHGFPVTDTQKTELLWNSLITVLVVAVIGVILAVAVNLGKKSNWRNVRPGDGKGVLIAVAVIVGGGVLYVVNDWVHDNAHGIAAGIMFGFVWCAVLCARRSSPIEKYRSHYTFVAWWMPIGGAVVGIVAWLHKLLTDDAWAHTVLVLELVELAPFMYYWVAQTFENWKVGLVTEENKAAA